MLENLEILNMPDSYGLKDISGLQANSNLKTLDISSSKVKTLEPISALQYLENINIESTPLDENKYTVISALMSLKSCKSLKKIQANNLSQQNWDALDKDRHTQSLSKQEILYVDELLPRVGEHEKTSDVASNALIMGIFTKNQDIFDKVFDGLLGGDNFDVTKLNNEILLFNLSCYYAINDDKAALLPTIEQALKQGKTPDQFMQDDDFSRYYEDEDFLAVLKQ